MLSRHTDAVVFHYTGKTQHVQTNFKRILTCLNKFAENLLTCLNKRAILWLFKHVPKARQQQDGAGESGVNRKGEEGKSYG